YTHEDDFNRIPGIEPFDTATGLPITLPFYLAKARIDSTYQEWSGFANASYAFTPKFSVQAGVRYADDHQTYAQDYSGAIIGPVPLIQEGVEDGTQTTWLLSASYKPS